MHKVQGRLLIISHVLVRCCGERKYLQGAFGRHVDALARRFEEVDLLTCGKPADGPLNEYYLRAQNVRIIAIPDISHPARMARLGLRAWGMLQAALRVSLLMRDCDVVHIRLPSPIGVVGSLAAKLARRPVFFYIAGDREQLLLNKGPLMYIPARLVQAFLRFLVKGGLSFTTGHVLARKFGGPSESVIPIVSTALDRSHMADPLRAMEKAASTPQEVLFVGAVGEAKGVDVLLRAIKALRDRGVNLRLRIIGRTHDGGRWLRQQINALGLQGGVTCQDHMAWDLVIYEYDKSDIFILPSRSEGVPHVVLEAMARGVPVVATNVGGIPTVVRHGENGLLVKVGSEDDLAQAIFSLLDDAELRKRLVLGGLETAGRYVLDDVIDSMVEKVCQHYGLRYTVVHEA